MAATPDQIAIYQAAVRAHQDADDRLTELLEAKYGKRAGDMRYQPAETPEIAQAMVEKLTAGNAQYAAWIATNPS